MVYDLVGGTIWNPAKTRVIILSTDLLTGVYTALLDEAAAQSARRCVFRPARRGQAEFASWVEYPVSFALSS